MGGLKAFMAFLSRCGRNMNMYVVHTHSMNMHVVHRARTLTLYIQHQDVQRWMLKCVCVPNRRMRNDGVVDDDGLVGRDRV